MQVIFISGPAASGKHTIGSQLSRLTGLPLFHNHLAVDAALSLFEFGTPGFKNLRSAVWRFALLLASSTVLAIIGCASDSAIVASAKRAPIPPEQVTLYFAQPADFEVIGFVRASSGRRWSEQRSVEYALKELKKQAANLGANGLLLVPKVDSTSTIEANYTRVTTKTLQGTAIFVKER